MKVGFATLIRSLRLAHFSPPQAFLSWQTVFKYMLMDLPLNSTRCRLTLDFPLNPPDGVGVCSQQGEVDRPPTSFALRLEVTKEVQAWLKEQKAQEIFMQGTHSTFRHVRTSVL